MDDLDDFIGEIGAVLCDATVGLRFEFWWTVEVSVGVE